MWKKTSLALIASAALATSAMQPVAAQGYQDGYDYRYDNRGYSDPNYNNDSRYYSDRDRYQQQRDQYERDRYNYDSTRAAGFDRMAYLRECERSWRVNRTITMSRRRATRVKTFR